MKRLLTLVLSVISLISFYGCGSSGSSSSSPAAAITGSSIIRGQVKGTDSVANIPVYLVKPDAMPAATNSAVRGNIQGTWYATTTNDAGEYAFVDVTEGTYNLIAQKDRFHSVVSPNVQVLRASTIDLDVTLTATGDISGKVILANGAEPTGVFVYIPGTSFMATIASDRTFTITGVPVGQYSLEFWGENIEKKVLSNASVVAGTATSVGTDISLTTKVGSSIYLAVSSPELGSVFYPNSDAFTLSVNASDSTAQITKVLFEFDDKEKMVLQDTEAPFALSFNKGQFLSGTNGVENTNGQNAYLNFGTISPVKITAFNSRGETKQIFADITIMSYAPSLMFSLSTYTGKDTKLQTFAGIRGLKSYEYKVIETQASVAPDTLSATEKENFAAAPAYTYEVNSMLADKSLVLSEGITPGKKYLVAARALTTSGYTQWSYEVESLHPVLLNRCLEIPTISLGDGGYVNFSTNGIADKFILEYSTGGASTTVDVVAHDGAGSYQIPNFAGTSTYYLRAKAAFENYSTEFSSLITKAPTQTTVIFDNVVRGLTTTGLSIIIEPVSETFSTSTTLSATNGTNVSYTKSDALSSSTSLVLGYSDLNLSILSDFETITFYPPLPNGVTVKLYEGGTIVATGSNP